MPEGRHAPWKYLPRPGARLSVTFGTPVPPTAVRGALGTTMREEVPGETTEAEEDEEEARRQGQGAHRAHGSRPARCGGAWAAGVGGSAYWPGTRATAAFTTTTEGYMTITNHRLV
jgi:hypothetical protein